MDFWIDIPIEVKYDGLLEKIFPSNKPPDYPYFKRLKSVKKSTPWRIKIDFVQGSYKDRDGIAVNIISEPAIFHKIVQLGHSDLISAGDYSYIIYENTEFVMDIARAVFLATIKEPEPLNTCVQSDITQKMKNLGFINVGALIDNGRLKIESGHILDGLGDLRSSIELFFYMIVEKLGETPRAQEKLKDNIELLEKAGYIDGETKGLILKVLYNSLYTILSERIHKREPCLLFNARLYFCLTEQIFDYLIEKIIIHNVKERQSDIK